MGFILQFIAGWATPLPIIAGPEALRPTLSRGLPFSQPSLSCQHYRQGIKKSLGQSRWDFTTYWYVAIF